MNCTYLFLETDSWIYINLRIYRSFYINNKEVLCTLKFNKFLQKHWNSKKTDINVSSFIYCPAQDTINNNTPLSINKHSLQCFPKWDHLVTCNMFINKTSIQYIFNIVFMVKYYIILFSIIYTILILYPGQNCLLIRSWRGGL